MAHHRASVSAWGAGLTLIGAIGAAVFRDVPPPPKAEVVHSAEFRNFDWSGLYRFTRFRYTLPDRMCLDVRMARVGERGDSVLWHQRDIWRLDRGVRWNLNVLARTYREVEWQAEYEVSEAYGDLFKGLQFPVPVRVGAGGRVSGLPSDLYRSSLRDSATGETLLVLHEWVAPNAPGADIRRAFSARRRAQRGDTGAVAGPGSGRLTVRRVATVGDPDSPTRRADGVRRVREPGTRVARLRDSLVHAWAVPAGVRSWAGEEVLSVREEVPPEGMFEIPAGFRQVALSEGRRFWPWDKAAKRRPPAPGQPPRLGPFAVLDAKRRTPLRSGPSARDSVRQFVAGNELLDPVELDPVNGFYLVRNISRGHVEGWVAAEDVEDDFGEIPANVVASEVALIKLARDINLRLRSLVLSSIRVESGTVVATVGPGWSRLDESARSSLGYNLSSLAAGGRGAVEVVFRDSVTARIVGRYPPDPEK